MPAKKKPAPVKTPVTIPITNRPNTTENVTCFDFVINQNNINRSPLKPKETLFIDDSFQNTESAKQTGLKTYLLSEKEDVADVFGL